MARPGLLRHRKFIRLARLLGSDALAVGHLEIIWQAAYEAGDANMGSSEDLEYSARWKGDAGVLSCALVESGFVDLKPTVTDDSSKSVYIIHDLFDHAPDYVQNRAAREDERKKEKACGFCGCVYHSPDYRSMYCTDRCKVAACRERKKPTVTDAQPTRNGQKPTVTGSNRTPAPAPAPAPAPITPLTGNGERSNGRRAGVSFADPESEDPIKRLEGWELSGLGAVTSVPEVKRALAEWILDLRARTPPIPPTPLGLREQISRLEGMGTVRALAAIKFSLAGQYKGICEDGSKGNGKAPVAATAPGVSSSYTKPIKYGL
jgi:hypothetical protein